MSYRDRCILWLYPHTLEYEANLLGVSVVSVAVDFEDLVKLGSLLDPEGSLAIMLVFDGECNALERGWISRRGGLGGQGVMMSSLMRR